MEILPKMHCVFGNIFLWGVHERQGYKPGGERNKDYNEKIHKIGIDVKCYNKVVTEVANKI